jgi:hypothetical protein
MEMQVWERSQEGTRPEEQCWCCKYGATEVRKAARPASEILRRWYIQCRRNKFILFYKATNKQL